ncbi:Coronin-7 [Phlyctochytrium planicorne]|nr:Coronin-7 [Phlyctochytrium planicorne]
MATTCSGRIIELKIWDCGTKESLYAVPFSSIILDFAFDSSGNYFAACSRDKALKIHNLKTADLMAETFSHEGTKGARLSWARNDRLLSVGFGRANAREVKLYNFDGSAVTAIAHTSIDTSTSQPNIFYDEDVNLLFLCAKGDTTVYTFELELSQTPNIKQTGKFSSSSPNFGSVFFAKADCDVRNIEVAKMFRIGTSTIDLISFILPRQKKQFFQDDVFPPTKISKGTLISEWKRTGKVDFDTITLKPVDMQALSDAPVTPPTVRKSNLPPKTVLEASPEEAIKARLRDLHQEDDDSVPLPQDKQQGAADDEWDD